MIDTFFDRRKFVSSLNNIKAQSEKSGYENGLAVILKIVNTFIWLLISINTVFEANLYIPKTHLVHCEKFIFSTFST